MSFDSIQYLHCYLVILPGAEAVAADFEACMAECPCDPAADGDDCCLDECLPGRGLTLRSLVYDLGTQYLNLVAPIPEQIGTTHCNKFFTIGKRKQSNQNFKSFDFICRCLCSCSDMGATNLNSKGSTPGGGFSMDFCIRMCHLRLPYPTL